MYMRDWLYLGFNEDESHRQVFDAVADHDSGTHRLLANVEFADPKQLLAPGLVAPTCRWGCRSFF